MFSRGYCLHRKITRILKINLSVEDKVNKIPTKTPIQTKYTVSAGRSLRARDQEFSPTTGTASITPVATLTSEIAHNNYVLDAKSLNSPPTFKILI